MKRMRHDQIPQFVADVIALGCNIRAIGQFSYVFRDADLSVDQYDAVYDDPVMLALRYGSRWPRGCHQRLPPVYRPLCRDRQSDPAHAPALSTVPRFPRTCAPASPETPL